MIPAAKARVAAAITALAVTLILIPLLAVTGCTTMGAATDSPYAGQEARDIKALSRDEIDGYLAGKGMGLAKAAELNGYAGPAHVLEMAAELRLTPEQKARTEALFAAMAAEATTLGRSLVDEERKLDRLFAQKAVTQESLPGVLAEIGALQGKLRAAHLQAHLKQVAILTDEQNARYAQLRGYDRAGDHSGHGPAHKH